ncbi:hypothetical protein CEXT_732641 [Caerostris extrusa]|uniref:Uncharacterized protein n=1 Tax=Caerostris extrusa TaxID=172846 RepID=A0AAV4QWY7_CAEEX|nr:hypothetical protein CEXT_732641 [Caerostris extrusa]
MALLHHLNPKFKVKTRGLFFFFDCSKEDSKGLKAENPASLKCVVFSAGIVATAFELRDDKGQKRNKCMRATAEVDSVALKKRFFGKKGSKSLLAAKSGVPKTWNSGAGNGKRTNQGQENEPSVIVQKRAIHMRSVVLASSKEELNRHVGQVVSEGDNNLEHY